MNDTIKMFIGDEEVVSDKEFTINEEILSASSTILNNCYPKSWELTKDYVSNFYYPKDYSKFILARGNYQYSTDQYYPLETNIENPVTYETNTDATWDNVYVYGETAQETAAGYNLFNLDGFLAVAQTVDCTVTQTTNGFSMSFTPGADARVGATYSQGATLPASVRSGAVKVRPNTTYTIYMSYRIADADIKAYISFFDKDYVATQNYVKLTSAPIETSYTFTTDANTLYLYLRFGVQTSSYDSWFYQGIQVVEGSQVIPGATYGKKPSLEFPSPLYSVGIKNHLKLTDGTYSHNGIRATVSNGYIILNGEAIGDTSFINIPCVVMNLDGMYTLSVNNVKTVGDDSFEGNFADIRVRIDDNNQLRAIFGIKNSYASANLQMTSPTVRIRTAVGLSYDNFVIKPVLTNDNLRHNFFLNYGIELINTNKNIFDGEFTQGSIYTDGTINKQNASFSITNTNLIAVKPEHNYIFSNNEGFKIDRIAYYDQQGLFILRTESLNIATFTAVPGCYFIRFNVQQNGITPDMLTDVMIRDAQSEAGYEEYKSNYLTYSLDEPLRKIGTTADSLYYENNSRVIERKIGYKVYNGTESWNYDSTNQRYWIALDNVVTPANVNTLGEAMSNIQLITANQTIYGTGYTGIALHPLGRVYITKDVYDSLTTTNVELQYIYENYFWSTTSYSIPHSYDGFNLAYVMNTRVETTIKVVYKWKNYDILFSGLVKNSGDISLNPRYPHYCSLQILDYKTFLSESDTLDFVISQKTIEQAIEMVVEAVSGYGFIVGEINIANANEIIGAYSTLNKTAYDVLQYLAEISGSRWRTRYVDSSTMAIDFYDPDLLPQANDIDYNKQYWKDNNIVDLTFSYGTRDYRNKQIILSNEVYGSIEYNEVLLSNGYSASVCASTPCAASTTRIAPSHAASDLDTS